MAATLYLLGCILLPGQTMTRPTLPPGMAPIRVIPSSSGDWLLVPRLHRAQELVYRGAFTEESRGGRVQFNRSYRLETRILVLNTPSQGADIAVLTLLKHRPAISGMPVPPGQAAVSGDVSPMSVRLERAHVDLQGKLTADADVNLLPPLDGAPTLECGVFVALPGGRLSMGQEWTAHRGRSSAVDVASRRRRDDFRQSLYQAGRRTKIR